MNKKLLIPLSIILITLLLIVGCKPKESDIYAAWTAQKFDKKAIIALKYAKVSLEEFDATNESDWLKDYDLANPFVTSNLVADENRNMRKVFLVAFPAKNKNRDSEGWANVYIPMTKGRRFFEMPLSTSFSTTSRAELLKKLKNIYLINKANQEKYFRK